MSGSQTTKQIWLSALPGVVACFGLVWIGSRVARVNARLDALETAAQPVGSQPPARAPQPTRAAPKPLQPPVEEEEPAIEYGPLDVPAFQALLTSELKKKLEATCWGPHGDGVPGEFAAVVTVNPKGQILTLEVDEKIKKGWSPSFLPCIDELVHTVVKIGPGKHRRGTITISKS